MAIGPYLQIGSNPRVQPGTGYPGTAAGLPVHGQPDPTRQDEVSFGGTTASPESEFASLWSAKFQALAQPRPSAGILYILDHFSSPGSLSVPGPFALIEHAAETGTEHGDAVARAARDQGYSGPIKAVESDGDPTPDVPAHMKVWLSSDDPQMLSLALNERMASARAYTLTQTEKGLQRILNDFPTNSVINLSQGGGQSNLLRLTLSLLRGDETDDAEKKQTVLDERRRVALALGLDAEKFCSADPKERDQVWPQAVQGLLDRAAATDQDARVLLAKASYDRTVQTLTSFGNSVVVSAGNEQDLPGLLEETFAEGGKFQFSPQFIGNDLVNKDTVAVGALHQGKVADYSNRLPSVHIYACGDLGEDQGTSLAAPRVAAVLAGLQAASPSQGPGAAQQVLREHYCIKQEVDSQPVFFLSH